LSIRKPAWKSNKWDCYNVGKDYKSRTANPRYFAGGDAVTGPDTVIAAIGAGHQAADDIDASIRKVNGEPAYEKPAMEKNRCAINHR